MKKIIFSLIVLVFLFGLWFYQNRKPEAIVIDLPPAQNYQDFANKNDNVEIPEPVEEEEPEPIVNTNTSVNVNTNTNINVSQPVVTSINLNVPFTSQAPTANWEQPFQDACEEASILMVDYYLQGKSIPAPDKVEDILVSMIDWQDVHLDGDIDMSIEDLSYLAENLLAYANYEIVEDLTVDKIKLYLDKGLPVIVPANGKTLANPNFRNGGPIYHMLVIKGYKDGYFITNDPGTRNGHNFVYTYENMMLSIADWDEQKHQVNPDAKVGLVLMGD